MIKILAHLISLCMIFFECSSWVSKSDTWIPFMICFKIGTAYLSGILFLLYISSYKVPLLQYYITIILKSLFMNTSWHFTTFGLLHFLISKSSLLQSLSCISLSCFLFSSLIWYISITLMATGVSVSTWTPL